MTTDGERPGLARALPGVAVVSPASPDSVPGRDRLPADACYVYFTSGSTGTPKAILGRRRSVEGCFHHEAGAALVFSVAPTKVLAFSKGTFTHTRHRF